MLLTLLLTQELEHGGEIFAGVTACAHHPVDLMGQGAERDRSPRGGGCVLRQAQVLITKENVFILNTKADM